LKEHHSLPTLLATLYKDEAFDWNPKLFVEPEKVKQRNRFKGDLLDALTKVEEKLGITQVWKMKTLLSFVNLKFHIHSLKIGLLSD
jgi:hypothetical protein